VLAENGRGGGVDADDPILALTGVREVVESGGGEDALWQPLELDAAMFWVWRRGTMGGDGRSVERWCSRAPFIARGKGEVAVP
jgi:hypothetical protein